jgi:hypothetical protein
MRSYGWKWLALLSVASCAGPAVKQAGGTASWISKVQVEQTQSALMVTATDSNNAQVAQLMVERANVVDPDYGWNGPGIILEMNVRGVSIEHHNIGLERVELPAPPHSEATEFMMDPRVAPYLDKWGIAVVQRPEPVAQAGTVQEARYSACDHDWPSTCGGTSSCCQDSIGYHIEDGCCQASPKTAFSRWCDPNCFSGCRGNPSGCGGNTGDNGCGPCWSIGYSSSCSTPYMGGGCNIKVDGYCYCDTGQCGSPCSCTDGPTECRCQC